MVLSYCVGRKKSPVPYKLLPLFGYFALALGLYGISEWIKPDALGWRLAWNTLLVLVYVAVVIYCERDLLKGMVRRKK